jgi:transcriptional regulator with XRE-family HTH domain
MAISETARVAAQLAVEVGISQKTAERWLQGEQVSAASAYALERAAERLEIELPQQEQASP